MGMPNINVGDGMTAQVGSDRYTYTVFQRSPSGKTLTLRSDNLLNDGTFNGQQQWAYETNPNGRVVTVRWSKKKQCYVSGGIRFGRGRHAYRDPHF